MRFAFNTLRSFAAALLAITLFAASPAAADPLDDAKAAGHLGERPDGYLGAVKPSIPAGAKAVMKKINAKRRAHYQSIAVKNKTSLKAVQAVVGAKVIREKVGPGEYYMNPSGKWIRK